jgi:hypothetical protein
MRNAAKLATWSTSQPKFWPKKPVRNVSGRRDGAGKYGGFDLVDVALQTGYNGRVVLHDLVQNRPEHR